MSEPESDGLAGFDRESVGLAGRERESDGLAATERETELDRVAVLLRESVSEADTDALAVGVSVGQMARIWRLFTSET